MTFYHVGLEPIETRYSHWWQDFFAQGYREHDMDGEVVYITGRTQPPPPEPGAFLNPIGTSRWKLEQLITLLNVDLRTEDVVFFEDIWFPGLEVLAYSTRMRGRSIRIGGMLHAGSYDPWDLTAKLRPWAGHFEAMLGCIADIVFVGSHWHSTLCGSLFPMIKEIPWPFAPPKRKGVAKHHRHVAIPMRPTKEKAVEEAIDICERAGVTYWCSGATLPREEYLTRLEESQFVLSTAQQETFGYAVLEGLALGCFPVVPDRLSYPELYPNHCRYKTIKDAVEILSGPELPLPVFPFERHQPGNVVGEILAGLK